MSDTKSTRQKLEKQMRSDIESGILTEWVGKHITREDTITQYPVSALSAILDRDDPEPEFGDELPPLWHWLYFLSADKASEIGNDGHVKRGDFLPPVPLPKRMRAGGRYFVEEPLLIGDQTNCVSTVTDIVNKHGRNGPLVFVTVRHEIFVGSTRKIVEEQDIVYHNITHPQPQTRTPSSNPAPAAPQWSRIVTPDPVLLFRFSALTFNSHRIHYDRDYAIKEEGYPGLVVQAPLVSIILLDLLRANVPDSRVVNIRFRAIRPLFDTTAFLVQGRSDDCEVLLWAKDSYGNVAMIAEVTLCE